MYKGQSGMWAWLFHRVTGLGLLVFLLIHIVDIAILSFGPELYNASVRLFDQVIVRLLSLFLVAALLFHGLNGVRVILVDFWRKGVLYQKVMFGIVLALCVILFIPVAYFVMRPTLEWLFTLPPPRASH